jgi:Putative metal-binding motif
MRPCSTLWILLATMCLLPACGCGRDICLFDCDNDGWSSQSFLGGPYDCADWDASINPDAEDLAGDGEDQNCDGVDGVDEDGDEYASLDSGGDDCDDSDDGAYPGADEICDGVDNDCDGLLGDGEVDEDQDGFLVCDDDCT